MMPCHSEGEMGLSEVSMGALIGVRYLCMSELLFYYIVVNNYIILYINGTKCVVLETEMKSLCDQLRRDVYDFLYLLS